MFIKFEQSKIKFKILSNPLSFFCLTLETGYYYKDKSSNIGIFAYAYVTASFVFNKLKLLPS